MSLGWILGLLGGGLSLAAIGAAIAFFAPQMWGPILETLTAGLRLALQGAWWLISTSGGRQVLLAVTTVLAFWWSGQRGWDRGVAFTLAQEKAHAAPAEAAGQVFRSRVITLNGQVKIQLALDLSHIKLTYDTMDKEVSRYVTPDIDRRFPLPCGLVRMHDAALLGADPAGLAAPGCQRDDATAPTTASAFSRNEVLWGRYTRALEADNAALRKTIIGYQAAYGAWQAKYIAINGGR